MNTPNKSYLLRRALARRHPSGWLLAAQFFFLILAVVFDGQHSERAILSAFGGLVLLLVIWVVSRSPGINWIAWVLAIPAFLLSILSAISENPSILAWSAILEAALYFYAAGSLIAYMLGDRRVTVDELFAAGATFTLLAWGFAYLYLVFMVWQPTSLLKSGEPEATLTFIELLFLSFTNLSATGLGDILPVSAATRAIAILEQFAGVGYITIVVSRLIGMTLATREPKRHRNHTENP